MSTRHDDWKKQDLEARRLLRRAVLWGIVAVCANTVAFFAQIAPIILRNLTPPSSYIVLGVVGSALVAVLAWLSRRLWPEPVEKPQDTDVESTPDVEGRYR